MLTHEGILPTPAIPRGRLGLAPSADGDAREADAGDIEALIAPFARATGRVPGSRRISDQGNLIREKAHPARSACCSTSDAESSHPFCSRKVRKERVETRIVPCGGLFADRCQRHAGGLPEQDGIHPVDIPFGVASVAVVNDGRILYIDTVDIKTKLAILADAAKYDASCAASGGTRRDSSRAAGGKGGIGSHEGTGICHSFTPDGRCISLLKILLTNFCLYDCLYCINRRSSNVRRARFSVQEVVELTLDFYRRNCIDGLFLSSGVIRNPDYTMEQLVQVARTLRETHDFRGYIHLKTIPNASPELLSQAGR